MNADAEVRAFFPGTLSRAASDASVARFRGEIDARGYGFWAVEETATGAFLGMAGVRDMPEVLADMGGVELGWRLRRSAWGQGFATEAGWAAIGFARAKLPGSEIYAFTAEGNARSVAVMLRLGMVFERRFDHPGIPEGHFTRAHVLYRSPALG